MHAFPRAAIAWSFVAAVLLGGCSATPPEEALRASVARLGPALEARDAGAVGALLADDFAGPDGMDAQAATRLARLSFLRHRDIGVALGPLDIAMLDGHATVRFTAVLTGGAGWLPERGSVYRVETGWRQHGDDWLLTSARWERDL